MKRIILLVVAMILNVTTANASDFGVQAGAGWNLATSGSQSDAIKGRSMNNASIFAFPHWNVTSVLPAIPFPLFVGPIGQFDVWGQQAEPSSVGNTNLRGNGWLAGLALGAEYANFTGIFGVEFLGGYSLTNKLTNGSESRYSSPLSWKFVVGYKLLPMLSVDANLQLTSYGTSNVEGTAIDIGSDKFKQTSYGLGVRYYFNP